MGWRQDPLLSGEVVGRVAASQEAASVADRRATDVAYRRKAVKIGEAEALAKVERWLAAHPA